MINYLAYTSKGNNHSKNEDRIFVNDKVISEGCILGNKYTEIIAGVCDGVGSTKGGDLAAQIVATSFGTWDILETSALTMTRHIHRINKNVLVEQELIPEVKNMATTVTGVVIYKDKFLLFNLGDSRIYFVENGNLTLKTQDHIYNYSNIFSKCSETIKEDALTGYIGGNGLACFPTINKGIFIENEVLIFICSDGVYKSLSEKSLGDVLTSTKGIKEKKETILQLLPQNGLVDDISFILIECKV